VFDFVLFQNLVWDSIPPLVRSTLPTQPFLSSLQRHTLLLCVLVLTAFALSPAVAADCPRLLDKSFARLQDDVPQSLCQYKGKVLLVVNTASFCGFTQQYEGLEALHQQYAGRGFAVLGFPSNDFGNQEPGSNEQIAAFCTNTFSIKFPMFAKTSVKGKAANPLFKELSRQSDAPGWNFHKYLIDKEGRLVRSYASQVAPGSQRLKADIEGLLAKGPPNTHDVNHKATQ